MADLLHILPDFDTESYSYLLNSLDRHQIITSDLLALETTELAKRAKLPLPQLRTLVEEITRKLHVTSGIHEDDIGIGPVNQAETNGANEADSKHEILKGVWSERQLDFIGTLDERLDSALAGGFPTGHVSEVTGESGAGKTQLLLSLLLSAQLQLRNGSPSSSLYLTTESPLPTSRLKQILATNPTLQGAGPQRPSLSRILTLYTPDLESQDHILRYQVPVAVERYNVRLMVIDSIAANFRAELELRRNDTSKANTAAGVSGLHERTSRLIQVGSLLRGLARTYNICIVVANQVADRFTLEEAPIQTPLKANAREEPSAPRNAQPPLSLEYQQRWFTGWGDLQNAKMLKTPSLGLVWANQIACRVALTKEPVYDWESHLRYMAEGIERSVDEVHDTRIAEWKRYFRVAFSHWAPQSRNKGVAYEIATSGIRSIPI